MPSLTKELMFNEIIKEFDASTCAFISTYNALSVADISDFRRQTEKFAKRSLHVKNTLAKKVFEKKKYDGAEKFLKGQVLVTFGTKEPQAISKVIIDFAKKNNKLVPTALIMDDKVYGQEYVRQLASLPSRHELLTQVVVRVKSPISGFVMTLGQLMRGFVVALNEVKKKKELQSA
jgi:large subunit ribosomal protein L10